MSKDKSADIAESSSAPSLGLTEAPGDSTIAAPPTANTSKMAVKSNPEKNGYMPNTTELKSEGTTSEVSESKSPKSPKSKNSGPPSPSSTSSQSSRSGTAASESKDLSKETKSNIISNSSKTSTNTSADSSSDADAANSADADLPLLQSVALASEGGRETSTTVIYIGDIPKSATEEEILSLTGPAISVKMLHDKNKPAFNYAFVEYSDHRLANETLKKLSTDALIQGTRIRANWAYQLVAQTEETQQVHLIFVGDLSVEINDEALLKAFEKYLSLQLAHVMWDMQTSRLRGYGFVQFGRIEDAEDALKLMNGAKIGSRNVRCNWALHRPTLKRKGPKQHGNYQYSNQPNYSNRIAPPNHLTNQNPSINQLSIQHHDFAAGHIPNHHHIAAAHPSQQVYGTVPLNSSIHHYTNGNKNGGASPIGPRVGSISMPPTAGTAVPNSIPPVGAIGVVPPSSVDVMNPDMLAPGNAYLHQPPGKYNHTLRPNRGGPQDQQIPVVNPAMAIRYGIPGPMIMQHPPPPHPNSMIQGQSPSHGHGLEESNSDENSDSASGNGNSEANNGGNNQIDNNSAILNVVPIPGEIPPAAVPMMMPPQLYDIVLRQTPSWQTTVYLGNIAHFTQLQDLIPLLLNFGFIVDFKFHPDKGCAFVKYDSHERAAMAIVQLVGFIVNGRPLKCGWGKDRMPPPSMVQYSGYRPYR